MNLKNKVVFITGANRGIGKSLLVELLKHDVKKVYATARNPDQIADCDDERVVTLALDITDANQVSAVAQKATDTDILINNAGVASFVSAFTGPMESIERDMQTNYFGTLSMMRAFIPALEKKQQSAIVNIASIAAFVNFPFLGGYSASKAALYSITQGARIELTEKGISVHSVNPGPIDTDMGKDVDMDKTSPAETAAAILDGFEAGEADIFPDPAGKSMFETWSNDYRDLEKMIAESA